MKKNIVSKINTTPQKILTISGLLVIALAIIASIDILITDRPYMHDIMDIGYYGRYLVTILGGVGVGFLFTKLSFKRRCKKGQPSLLWLTCISFGLLTLCLYYLLDFIRLPVREVFGDLPFPWGKVIFMGLPFGALILAALLALIAFLKGAVISVSERWFQLLFAGVFIVEQIMTIFFSGIISSYADYSAMTLLIGLLALLVTPVAVTAIAYIAFGKLKDATFRFFAATTVGASYLAATYMSWEFRTNPDYQATLVFSTISTVLIYLTAMVLIAAIRRSIKN